MRVDAYGIRFGTRNASTTTGSTGAFELNLAEGEYAIYIEPPWNIGLGDVRLDVSVTPKSSRIDYRYTGIRVQGTVLGPTGASVDSGDVLIYSASIEYYVSQRFRNGAFSVLVPYSGSYRVSAYSLDRSIPFASQTLALTSDTTLVIQIEGVPVMGTLFGPDGAGIKGASIRSEEFSYAESDAGGRYQFWVRPGGQRFRISPPDDMEFILPRISSFLTISGPTTLDVSLAGTRWSGAVRSATDSSTISSAIVSAYLVADYYGRRAVDTTGSNGAFELILESGKEYDLVIETPSTEQPHVIRGLIASADTTFNLYVESPIP